MSLLAARVGGMEVSGGRIGRAGCVGWDEVPAF